MHALQVRESLVAGIPAVVGRDVPAFSSQARPLPKASMQHFGVLSKTLTSVVDGGRRGRRRLHHVLPGMEEELLACFSSVCDKCLFGFEVTHAIIKDGAKLIVSTFPDAFLHRMSNALQRRSPANSLLVTGRGAQVAALPCSHRPRRAGKSPRHFLQRDVFARSNPKSQHFFMMIRAISIPPYT